MTEEINTEEDTLAEEQLTENESDTQIQQDKCELLRGDVSTMQANIAALAESIGSIPAKIINIDDVRKDISAKEKEVQEKVDRNYQLGRTLKANVETLTRLQCTAAV